MTSRPVPLGPSSQHDLYEETRATLGAALDRLVRSYEADPDKRQDLSQEIHLALWRSFEGFDNRCSLRTWVYRVAHNVAATHIVSLRRTRSRNLVSLDALETVASDSDAERTVDRAMMLDRLYALIQQLTPLDRQVLLLYLEGVDAASIGEITGFSSGNVATKIHRIKKIIADRFRQGGQHER